MSACLLVKPSSSSPPSLPLSLPPSPLPSPIFPSVSLVSYHFLPSPLPSPKALSPSAFSPLVSLVSYQFCTLSSPPSSSFSHQRGLVHHRARRGAFAALC